MSSLSLLARTLVGLGCVFAIAIVLQVWFFNDRLAVVMAAPDEMPAAGTSLMNPKNQNRLQAPPISVYGEIVDRPLFSDTRRPPPQDTPVASRRADQMSTQWKLTGVVSARDESYVLLQGTRNRQTMHLQKGQLIDGWRIADIGIDYVSLTSGNDTVILELRAEAAADE